jgi:hypothetical protein
MAAQLPLLHPLPARGPSWRRRQQQLLPRPQRQPRSPLRRRKRPAPQFRNPKSPRRRQHRLLLRRAASSCRRPDRAPFTARLHRLRLLPLPAPPEASSADAPFSIVARQALPADLAAHAPAWARPDRALLAVVRCTPPARRLEALRAPVGAPAWVRALALASDPALEHALEWGDRALRRHLRRMRRVRSVLARAGVAGSNTRRPKKAR